MACFYTKMNSNTDKSLLTGKQNQTRCYQREIITYSTNYTHMHNFFKMNGKKQNVSILKKIILWFVNYVSKTCVWFQGSPCRSIPNTGYTTSGHYNTYGRDYYHFRGGSHSPYPGYPQGGSNYPFPGSNYPLLGYPNGGANYPFPEQPHYGGDLNLPEGKI